MSLLAPINSSQQVPFAIIGVDSALLETPFIDSRLANLGSGERVDILINFDIP
jgi:hypothetical protein